MNTKKTKNWIDEHGIIAMKADKTNESPNIDALLVELGNEAKGIPFIAIYPGDGSPPITLSGPVTQDLILEKLEEAGPSVQGDGETDGEGDSTEADDTGSLAIGESN